MDLFTSSTLQGMLASLRDVGYLEAAAGAVFALGFGFAYVFLRSQVGSGENASAWGPILRFGPRNALGAIFLVIGGLNGLFQFVPEHPSSLRESCVACAPFLNGILSTGYLFPFIKIVELVAGGLLIAGLWVPLATVILSPIVLNIGLYHLFLNPSGLLIAIVIAVLHGFVAWQNRAAYSALMAPNAPALIDAPRAPAAARR